jgi:hypothetical protein
MVDGERTLLLTHSLIRSAREESGYGGGQRRARNGERVEPHVACGLGHRSGFTFPASPQGGSSSSGTGAVWGGLEVSSGFRRVLGGLTSGCLFWDSITAIPNPDMSGSAILIEQLPKKETAGVM